MSEFRILLYLTNVFNDHRSLSRIYINKNIKCVGDLEEYIRELFEIDVPFYLMADHHYLPPSTDIRILEKDESVILMKRHLEVPPHQSNERRSFKKRRILTGIPKSKLEVHNMSRKSKMLSFKACGSDSSKDAHKSDGDEDDLEQLDVTNKVTIERGISCNNSEVDNPSDTSLDLSKIANSTTIGNIAEDSPAKQHEVIVTKYSDKHEPMDVTDVNETKENCIKEHNEKDSEYISFKDGTEVAGHMNNFRHPGTERKDSNSYVEEKERGGDKIIIKDSAKVNHVITRKPFAVSSVMQLLNANDESTFDSSNLSKPKRKRVRKRKKKNVTPSLATSVSISGTNVANDAHTILGSLPKSTKQSLHLRFDSDYDDDQNNSSCSCTTVTREGDKPTAHLNPNVVEESTKESAKQTNNEDDVRKYNLDGPLSDSIIKKFPRMTNVKPRQFDVIMFKVLKMREDYCPTISEYIAGKVIHYDRDEDVVRCKIIYGKDELKEPNGKFSLTDDTMDDEDEPRKRDDDETYYLNWSDLKDVRLLFP